MAAGVARRHRLGARQDPLAGPRAGVAYDGHWWGACRARPGRRADGALHYRRDHRHYRRGPDAAEVVPAPGVGRGLAEPAHGHAHRPRLPVLARRRGRPGPDPDDRAGGGGARLRGRSPDGAAEGASGHRCRRQARLHIHRDQPDPFLGDAIRRPRFRGAGPGVQHRDVLHIGRVPGGGRGVDDRVQLRTANKRAHRGLRSLLKGAPGFEDSGRLSLELSGSHRAHAGYAGAGHLHAGRDVYADHVLRVGPGGNRGRDRRLGCGWGGQL